MFALSFLLVDPDVLGRPDKDSLPQHTLIEILIDAVGRFDKPMLSQQCFVIFLSFVYLGLDNVDAYYGSQENPTDVCIWEGVMCNPASQVVYCNWLLRGQRGTIDFRFLPGRMKILDMSVNLHLVISQNAWKRCRLIVIS
ncbi:hypothetical protein XU18_4768 [Perkinsela sp. CCAP 1560/4]|nr:hypothetical protein XU18_4768 [Perkinsela sp. CCAP 1560/4]|eukprot:KNH03879.1 hypothetical protein XU18_4768 [Perkinsela sp. CCAP 1560/4]